MDEQIDAIISLAKRFIAINSSQGNFTALEEIITLAGNELTGFEIKTFIADGNPSLLIHNAKPGAKHFKIMLNAHLDVVAGKDEQYRPQIKNGKLYGRGAYDMKAAAAVMIMLFKEIASQIDYPIALQLVSDEELADGNGTNRQLEQGISTDMAIIGECGSNFDIIHENKGLLHAYLTSTGTAAHGAYPWKGENAIMKMHHAIAILHSHFPTPDKETAASTMNIAQISTTNQTWNLVPDNCKATLDIRVSREDKQTILTKIQKLLPTGVVLTAEKTRNPHYTDPNNKYIKLLKDTSRKVLGKDPVVRKTFGGSDTVFFSDRGFDAIEFGPIGKNQHSDDEWVDIKSLKNYYTILTHFLLAIDEKESKIEV